MGGDYCSFCNRAHTVTIIVSGRTFEHRNLLMRLGGDYVMRDKCWRFWDLDDRAIALLRNTVGLIVTEQRPRAAIWDDLDDEPPIPTDPVQVGDDMTYYNHFADQDPIAYFGFSSLGAFADHVASLPRPANSGGTCDIGWTADPGFAGTKSLAEALQIARTGWLDGLGMMDRLLAPEPRSKRRARSMTGGRVNVGRMLSGAPDHMVTRKRLKGHCSITLFVETTMDRLIKVDTALIRVVLISAIVDQLESCGYSCSIVAICSSLRRDVQHSMQTVVRIKDFGERLSVSDVSFAFGHPAFLRRLVFAIEGATPQCMLTHSVRGIPSEAFTDEHPPGRNEFYIPQIRSNVSDIWQMLDMLQPDDLPIKLKGDH